MSRARELQVRGAVRAALEELQQRSEPAARWALRRAVADLGGRRRSSPFVYAYLDPRHRLLAGDYVTAAAARPGGCSRARRRASDVRDVVRDLAQPGHQPSDPVGAWR